MCKYGDFFLYLDIEQDDGIKNTIGLPSNEIERLEGEDKNNPNYVQYQWNTAGLTLENWQVGHFRVLGNDKFAPYGTSVLEPARRIWRQLTLLEDAVMAYRIVRSPDRRVFYIDVGGIPPEDVEQYMQKVMTQMKRNQNNFFEELEDAIMSYQLYSRGKAPGYGYSQKKLKDMTLEQIKAMLGY
jgi:hypothetical protein